MAPLIGQSAASKGRLFHSNELYISDQMQRRRLKWSELQPAVDSRLSCRLKERVNIHAAVVAMPLAAGDRWTFAAVSLSFVDARWDAFGTLFPFCTRVRRCACRLLQMQTQTQIESKNATVSDFGRE